MPPSPPKEPGFIFGIVTNIDKGKVTMALQVSSLEGLRSFLDVIVRPRAVQLGYDVQLIELPVVHDGPKAL